jgi:Tol biopolymer transport system component
MLVVAGLALIGGDLGAGAALSSLRGRIVFSTTSVSYYESGDLFLAEAGRPRRNLTRSADRDESAPALSPDETMLAFAGASRGRSDIYVRSLAGATVRNVTNDPEEDRLPTWSPDGTMLAFARGLREQELWVIGADGRGRAPGLDQDDRASESRLVAGRPPPRLPEVTPGVRGRRGRGE